MNRPTALDAILLADDTSPRRLRLLERPVSPAGVSPVPARPARGWAGQALARCARWLVSARLMRM